MLAMNLQRLVANIEILVESPIWNLMDSLDYLRCISRTTSDFILTSIIKQEPYLEGWVTKSDLPELFLIRMLSNIADINQKSLEGPFHSGIIILDSEKPKKKKVTNSNRFDTESAAKCEHGIWHFLACKEWKCIWNLRWNLLLRVHSIYL